MVVKKRVSDVTDDNLAVMRVQATERRESAQRKQSTRIEDRAASLIKSHRTRICVLDCSTFESSVRRKPLTLQLVIDMPQHQGTRQLVSESPGFVPFRF
jgi:hypothetical protein